MKTSTKLYTAGAIAAFSLSLVTGLTAQQQRTPGQEGQQRGPQATQPGQLPGQAQQRGPQATRPGQAQQMQFHRADDLHGSEVTSSDGERLGTLNDLAVELEGGKISYAIISSGGLLGVGADWRPVPPSALQIRGNGSDIELVLNITESQWENAPTIDREQINQLAQETRGREIYQFYGEDWQQRQGQQFGAPQRDGQPQGQQRQQTQQQQTPEPQQRQQGQQQIRQIEQQLQQAMTQAGVSEQQAQQEARRLAQQFTQERPDRQEIQQQVHQTLIQAGVGQQQAQQESQRIAQQIERQIGQQPQTQVAARQQQQRQQQQQAQQGQIHLATDLMDFDIVDQQQEEIGKISDFLVSLDQGVIGFVLFTDGSGVLGVGGDEYAVAPQAFERIGDEQATLNITQSQLEQARTLTRQQAAMQARQQAQMDPNQARQSPQVFRFQDAGDTGAFGRPDRDRDQRN